MPKVDSTAIKSIRYERAHKVLFVTFRDGDLYRYFDVAPEAYQAFLAAPSKGAFFAAEVRGRYAYELARSYSAA